LLSPTDPTNGETGVDRTVNIVFKLTDETDVVLSTVLIRIDRGAGWETVYTGSAFQPGWQGASSGVTPLELENGYIFSIDPETDLPAATVITVEVTAEDSFGNVERLS
jgi:hypothetical protein